MKNQFVSTSNTERFFGAAAALEAAMSDPDELRLGLVSGDAGMGKTAALEAYHSGQSKKGYVKTAAVRALPHWRPPSFLKGLLKAIGRDYVAYRTDVMWDWLITCFARGAGPLSYRRNPSNCRRQETRSLVESYPRYDFMRDLYGWGKVLCRTIEAHASFWSRINRTALVYWKDNPLEDVQAVIQERAPIPFSDEACQAIYKEPDGKSIRYVTERLREILLWSDVNGVDEFGLREYGKMTGRRMLRSVKATGDGDGAANA